MAESPAVRRFVVIGIVVLVLALAMGVTTMIALSPEKNLAFATWMYVWVTLVLALAAVVAGYFAKRNVEAFERAHDDQMTELQEQRRQFEAFERLSFRPFVTVSKATVDESGQNVTVEIANVGRGPALQIEIAMWVEELEGNKDDIVVFESHRSRLFERIAGTPPDWMFKVVGLSPGTSTLRPGYDAKLRPGSMGMAMYRISFEDIAGTVIQPNSQTGAVEPPEFP